MIFPAACAVAGLNSLYSENCRRPVRADRVRHHESRSTHRCAKSEGETQAAWGVGCASTAADRSCPARPLGRSLLRLPCVSRLCRTCPPVTDHCSLSPHGMLLPMRAARRFEGWPALLACAE
eukprot:6791923-Prymnesium_polylepis.1